MKKFILGTSALLALAFVVGSTVQGTEPSVYTPPPDSAFTPVIADHVPTSHSESTSVVDLNPTLNLTELSTYHKNRGEVLTKRIIPKKVPSVVKVKPVVKPIVRITPKPVVKLAPKPISRPVVRKPAPAPVMHNVSASVGTARQYALSRIGAVQFTCLDKLWYKESHWQTHELYGPTGAYGIPQAVPGNKMASAGPDWRDNPLTQVKWGLGYIHARYGSACNAWAHSERYNWY